MSLLAPSVAFDSLRYIPLLFFNPHRNTEKAYAYNTVDRVKRGVLTCHTVRYGAIKMTAIIIIIIIIINPSLISLVVSVNVKHHVLLLLLLLLLLLYCRRAYEQVSFGVFVAFALIQP